MPYRVGLAVLLFTACTVPPSGERIEVVIPAGSSIEAIAESLAVRGVIKYAAAFRRYANMNHADAVVPGVYYLESIPLGELLQVLQRGPSLGKVIVPEGAMLIEVAAAVERALGMSSDSFIAATTQAQLLARVSARGETLAGCGKIHGEPRLSG